MAWKSIYIRLNEWDVITHSGPNFNGSLVKAPLK